METREEIWAIPGETWILPIKIVWMEEDTGEVLPAVPMLKMQRAALFRTLAQFMWEAHDKLWISRRGLTQIGRPFEGDPEIIVRWAPRFGDSGENSDEEEEWIKWCAAGKLIKEEDMRIDWECVIKWALVWLLVQKRTLDLRSCRIRAVPLRSNWKEMLMDYFEHLTPKQMEGDKAGAAIADRLLQPDMLAVDRTDAAHCQWH